MAIIIDGKLVSEKVKNQVKIDVKKLINDTGIQPGLAAVLVGDDPASKFYVGSKAKTCNALGIYSEVHDFQENTTQEELTNLILKLNDSENIHGILVQLPLPNHIDENEILEKISYKKDVDGLTSYQIAGLVRGSSFSLEPCTPKGILTLLDYYSIPTEGKHVVVVGRSNIVGRPISLMLSNEQRNSTVTVCHSRTKDLSSYTRDADILIAAIGREYFITEDMVKDDAVVIDVGINRVDDVTRKKGYRIVGDVDFNNVKDKCSYITQVPGGVGLMTVASLMQNVVKITKEYYCK